MHNLILSPIDPEKLISSISDQVTANLIAVIQDKTPIQTIIDGDELIQKLGITRQTLARWRKQNRIPFIQVGGVIRYDLNKVIEALENRKGGRHA